MAKRMLQMDCKIAQQLYIYAIHNVRELREKPYMIITQVPKVHLENMLLPRFYYRFKFILKCQAALREATSLSSFPGEVWGREMKTVSFRLSEENDKLPAITSSSQHFSETSR